MMTKMNCYDVDECKTNNGRCALNSRCINTMGSYICGECREGYVGNQSVGCHQHPGSCPDGTICDPNAECELRRGSLSYQCRAEVTVKCPILKLRTCTILNRPVIPSLNITIALFTAMCTIFLDDPEVLGQYFQTAELNNSLVFCVLPPFFSNFGADSSAIIGFISSIMAIGTVFLCLNEEALTICSNCLLIFAPRNITNWVELMHRFLISGPIMTVNSLYGLAHITKGAVILCNSIAIIGGNCIN
ncbi:cartilage oligomeric matrix protein [Trichonephila clavipes]|nr:cartilage oligomeric matrix protein [Trichonephila clavipes]